MAVISFSDKCVRVCVCVHPKCVQRLSLFSESLTFGLRVREATKYTGSLCLSFGAGIFAHAHAHKHTQLRVFRNIYTTSARVFESAGSELFLCAFRARKLQQ